MYENDPSKSTEELLKQIKSSCQQKTSEYLSNVAFALPTFSALLVKLSKEASKTADKNIRIQRVLIGLTIALFLLTCVLLYIGYAQLSVSRAIDQPTNLNYQENEKANSDKKENTQDNFEIKRVNNNHNKE